ncbi:hypothetical protein TNCV_330731 [Trichonephila clavipes]|nr:hypothetical protein TNCV_330731 [Trichonephila clavipes]
MDESVSGSFTFSSSTSSRSSLSSSYTSSGSVASYIAPGSCRVKSTLYFEPLNNCERQPVRLIAKRLNTTETPNGWVHSFVLKNPNSHTDYGFRIVCSSKTVKVFPRRGIVKNGNEVS